MSRSLWSVLAVTMSLVLLASAAMASSATYAPLTSAVVKAAETPWNTAQAVPPDIGSAVAVAPFAGAADTTRIAAPMDITMTTSPPAALAATTGTLTTPSAAVARGSTSTLVALTDALLAASRGTPWSTATRTGANTSASSIVATTSPPTALVAAVPATPIVAAISPPSLAGNGTHTPLEVAPAPPRPEVAMITWRPEGHTTPS